MINDTQIIALVGDVANFNLGIFGIAITLFTVLYAFILSKKDSLIQLNDIIKSGDSTPQIIQRVTFYYIHVKKWKKINVHLRIIIIISFIFFIAGYIIKYLPVTNFILNLGICLIILSILLLFYIVSILILVFINYEKSTEIN